MMKKKKKKARPQKTTLKREVRLQRAKDWIGTYAGKNIVKGYAKKYHTDLLVAITELRMLGVEVSAIYEAAVKRSFADLADQKKKKIMEKEGLSPINDFQDDNFAFIAGYTNGGTPYGLRWDEVDDLNRNIFKPV